MKTIRSLMTLAGLIVAVFAISATGANAQAISATSFSGTFTLPVAAQWGRVTLPAGTYNLHYGSLSDQGTYEVEVVGKAKGSPHAVIPAQSQDSAFAGNSALVCIREGGALIVRALEMPSIGTAANFDMPHSSRLAAQNKEHNAYTQLAEAPMLLERVPVTFNAK